MGKIIAGNWKMVGTRESAAALVPTVAAFAAAEKSAAQIILCPPTPLLPVVEKLVQGSFLVLGAQDVSSEKEGAFTGEVSALMLKDAGCRYVIVGHSERRSRHGETDALVRAKAAAAQGEGLIPIICVGETQAEREAGKAVDVVSRQVKASAPAGNAHFLLAYEPVWAIGSGKIPSSADIAEMHAAILALIPGAKILYGGSVKAANAEEIFAVPGVAGVLVGGASLKAEEFCGIIAASE